MRIGVNALFYLPGAVGGAETYLLETLRALAALGGGHRFALFTQRDNDTRLRAEFAGGPFAFHPSPFSAQNRFARILREQTELPWRVSRARVDVLWSPGYTLPAFCPCPQVVSILDMQYKSFPEDLVPLARLTTDVLVRVAARRARHILAISRFSRDEILRHTQADAGRVHVSLLAADPAFRDLPAVRPAGLPDPYVLCVANTYPHKAVDRAIRAFARLEDRIPHRLVLVGQARLGEPAVEKAMAAVRDPSRVSRLSGLSREDLIALYQHADAFVFPSLYEGFGLPVLEALFAGTPVVTTRCGSLPEVGGDAVETYDPTAEGALEEALLRVLSRDAATREAVRQRGRAHAAGFTWESCARETLRVLGLAAATASRSAK